VKITLNENQAEVLDLIKEDKRHYGIFFDMGVGKTPLILSLIEYIVFDKLEELRTLIVAPASVANELQVWQDEIEKWENFDYFDYIDLSGTKKKREQKLSEKQNSITIMSDALVEWWYNEYGNLDMFDMIVVDESSRFKSAQAKKFKKLSHMINLNKHRVYLLTGTPVPNGWEDIWSQIYLLDKGERLGKSYWKFIDTYFMTFGYKKYLKKADRLMILDLIKDVCVFANSDKIKLPPKVEEKIYFEFSQEKQKLFNNFKRDYVLELLDKDVTVLSKQILINKCLQLSNGCVYHDKLGNYTVFDNTKLEFVRKYSEEHPDENILVFYAYKFDKKRLMELPGAEAIDDLKSKNKWNKGQIKLGIISPFAFQYGGNLQSGGYTIIWFGLIWALENYLQSNKRIWRQGQKHAVKIMYLMMKNTWDEYVYKCVVSKELDQKEFLENIDIKKL
jgi:SNF2 family DNA or RNA helicase